MPDNPELRIVITGEDSTGKQVPAPQSGVDPSKPAPQTGPSVPERAGLDAIVAANLAALREAIGRNDKTSKEAVETLKVLGSAKAALPGAEQYRALLESVVKGRLNPPQPPPSQPAAKLPESPRVARLPAPAAEASRRGIIVLPRDQYTVDATQRPQAIGPPRPPDWQPPRLPGPGQPQPDLPGPGPRTAAGFIGGPPKPPNPPGATPPQPNGMPESGGEAAGVEQAVGAGLTSVTMFLGALYFGSKVVGEFVGLLKQANMRLESDIQRYRPYEGTLAAAAALRDVQSVMRDIRRAQFIGPELARFTTQSGNTYQAWQDLKARIERMFLPALTRIADVLEKLAIGAGVVLDALPPLVEKIADAIDVIAKLNNFLANPLMAMQLNGAALALRVIANVMKQQAMQGNAIGNADDVLKQLLQIRLPQAVARGPFMGAPVVPGPPNFPPLRNRQNNPLGGGGFF